MASINEVGEILQLFPIDQSAFENNLQAFKTILDLKEENTRLRTELTNFNEKDNEKEALLQSLQTQVNK